MHFALAAVIAALPLFIPAAPQPAKQGGTAIPLSKRSSLLNADKSVNIEALKSHVASTKAKIFRGFDNFEKNTGTLHPSAMSGPRKRATGGVPLDNYSGDWFGSIEIGTPPQLFVAHTLTVMMDTGSSDLILPGPDCERSCDGHEIYEPDDSLTSVGLDESFSIDYVDNNHVSGELYTDTVTIAGLTANEQIIGAALTYSPGLQVPKFLGDGLMGMAFQSVSAYDASPVFQTLVSDGQTNEAVFALSLEDPGPELYLGGTNPDMYIGDFTYTAVTTPGFWEVRIDSIQVNGETVLTDVASIMDTGSEFIFGQPEDVVAIYEAIPGAEALDLLVDGYYTFPCDEVPNISFTFGGTSFPISSHNINGGAISPDSEDCIGTIVGADIGESTWLVGNAFLSDVYTAFDVGNMRVGFAALPTD
ncbi:acid protease [Gyrodon lividus]|nr:acid protease [Gyrodon lividus]